MRTNEAIKRAGSKAALAKILGVTRGAVSNFGEYLPEARVWQLRVIRPMWFKEAPQKEVA